MRSIAKAATSQKDDETMPVRFKAAGLSERVDLSAFSSKLPYLSIIDTGVETELLTDEGGDVRYALALELHGYTTAESEAKIPDVASDTLSSIKRFLYRPGELHGHILSLAFDGSLGIDYEYMKEQSRAVVRVQASLIYFCYEGEY